MNILHAILPILLAAQIYPVTSSVPEGVNIVTSGTASIGGVSMMDQWGNPWIEIMAQDDRKKALVAIYSCEGEKRIIGEVPLSALGKEDNFAGFKPYLNATREDLESIYLQKEFERSCITSSKALMACPVNPRRDDCVVVTKAAAPHGTAIHEWAWKMYETMHPVEGK